MSNDALDPVLSLLSDLVAINTENPPRAITADGPLAGLFRQALPGFDLTVTDHGEGCITYLLERGAPTTLFNVHLDTVPVAEGWTRPPHNLTHDDDRAYGLGACDIKGAAACLIHLGQTTSFPAAFLFSTDEEAGTSVAVRGFLEGGPDYGRVIVAEPTQSEAIRSHRGIQSGHIRFSGKSGHASAAGTSAVHNAARFIAEALERPWASSNRLNFGRIEGGVKPNMIAASADVLFGFRTLPGGDPDEYLADLSDSLRDKGAELTPRFRGPALPGPAPEAQRGQEEIGAFLSGLGVDLGEPVNFWTEASLFSAAGYPTAVLGPGDIAQAHIADEWVAYDQLMRSHAIYHKILSNDG